MVCSHLEGSIETNSGAISALVRFGVKNDSVNAKRTETKCIIFFFPDQKNQENRSTSVNTPFCCYSLAHSKRRTHGHIS